MLEYRTIVPSLNDAKSQDSYEIENPRLVNINDNVATLIYSVTAKRGTSEFVALNSTAYSMVNGEIKLNLYQQTTITHQFKNFKTDKVKFENVKFQSMNNGKIPDPNVVHPIGGYYKEIKQIVVNPSLLKKFIISLPNFDPKSFGKTKKWVEYE